MFLTSRYTKSFCLFVFLSFIHILNSYETFYRIALIGKENIENSKSFQRFFLYSKIFSPLSKTRGENLVQFCVVLSVGFKEEIFVVYQGERLQIMLYL